MSYPGRPPIMQGLPMYMPMGAPAPPLMPAVMPLQHVSEMWPFYFIAIILCYILLLSFRWCLFKSQVLLKLEHILN